jgi:hypothetical protein
MKSMSWKTRNIVILLSLILVLTITLFSLGIAYAGGVRGIGLLGVCFFFTGGIVVVLAQLIPAGILLSSFMGSAFSSFRRGEMPVRAT